mmetsp:Transcript_7889/g.23165  ORF Transcript_7889/g.23165 Transcript_7889/m.23165 type:complete len:293 (-) Transcript_7889:274-1152(-)
MSRRIMAGALPASPSLVICRIWLTGPPSTLVAAKKQSSSCEAFAASASGVAAAIAACCTSRPQPSRRRQRESVSLMPSQPSAKSTTGLGAHGNASPSGSPPHAPLALPLMVAPVAPSTVTSVGMPSTPKKDDSLALRGSPCGMARKWGPMLPKYSWKLFWSRSELTKRISNALPAALSLPTVLTSSGVKPRHGGHQCAEKYKTITLPSPLSWLTSAASPSCMRNSSPRQSQNVGGVNGKSPSITSDLPSLVMIAPSPSSKTSDGMPDTLYFLESAALTSRLPKGSASQGCSA